MKIFYISRCKDCPHFRAIPNTKGAVKWYCVYKGETPKKRKRLSWNNVHIYPPTRKCPLPDDQGRRLYV